MLNEIQEKINKTEYWDVPVLDLKISYFGDIIELIIDNDEESCWKLSFLTCYRVSYETDAGWPNWRGDTNVSDMNKSQLGYYGQNISVSRSEVDGFYMVEINLAIMELNIECKRIFVKKILKKDTEFFWNKK